MISHFDHTYSFLRDNGLSEALDRFERAGFVVWERKVRHPAGVLSGFIRLTGGHLELLSVVSEKEFGREASVHDKAFRADPRPYAVGAATDKIEELRAAVATRFPEIKPSFTQGELDIPGGPAYWTFCEVPHVATPGAELFAVRYNTRRKERFSDIVGANTIYGIGGFVFCSEYAAARAAAWNEVLSLISNKATLESNRITLGLQNLSWLSSSDYETAFGVSWKAHASECGELAAVRLLAASLREAAAFLENAGFRTRWSKDGKTLFVQPDSNTGLAFVVEAGSPTEFKSWLEDAVNLK